MIFGIAVCLLVVWRSAKTDDFPMHDILSLLPWGILFGFIGARLFHVVDTWYYYAGYPVQILMVWAGGLSWYGGLIGGVLATLVYARVRKIPLGRLLDTISVGILGLAVGRIGCTINGDAYGTLTSLPWGVTYTHHGAYAPLGVPGHPAPVYEIIWISMMLVVLWKLRKRLKPEGSLFLATIAMYSLGRFCISWVRVEPAVLWPLHQAHIISLVLFAGCGALFAYRSIRESGAGL